MGLGIRGAGAGDDNSKVAVDCLLISSRWVASFLFYVTLSDITFNLTRIRQKGTTSIIRGCHYQYQRKKRDTRSVPAVLANRIRPFNSRCVHNFKLSKYLHKTL